MSYRLPPLNSLRLFEAAGRHLSFKQAAEELHVTPSAVSHAIKSLEDWFGIDLFLRDRRRLDLTTEGALYLPRVRDALDALAIATDALPNQKALGQLSVSSAPTFGLRWLIPNLHRFSERYPNIRVALDTSHRQMAFPRDRIDMAIRMGRGNWSNLHATHLAQEALVPVCAPEIAKTIGSVGDLSDQTLLHVTSVAEDWAGWATPAEAQHLDLERGISFDTIDLAVRAAVEGLGVAVGRLPLVASELLTGRLVAVLGPPRQSGTGYWLATKPDAFARPEVVSFRSWLCSELKSAMSVEPAQVPE